MNAFSYRNGQLHAESVPLATIATQYGTPCFVYSRAYLEERFRGFREPLGTRPHLICYAVKANSNLAVLKVLADAGAGFDIVSEGELERVLAAGGAPGKIIFSGVGKSAAEMHRALDVGIHCFNVESWPELERLSSVAASAGKTAAISLRVNPDVDAQTHPYISTGLKDNKFGVPIGEALAFYRKARELPGIEITGVDCHIGSQLTTLAPILDALDRMLALIDTLQAEGIAIRHLDLGGGLGVRYNDEDPPSPEDYMKALLARIDAWQAAHVAAGTRSEALTLVFEPGRAIVANAGVMLTRVEYLKEAEAKNFAVIDGAMNDIIRPALYEAVMNIIPVEEAPGTRVKRTWDIVGPICESADFLGQDRELALAPGDLLAVCSAGAYCFAMSSNYNTRNRAAEVMVDGERHVVVRRRETYGDQLALESVLPN
jgi:diaminopimelate decarboxylase